MVDPKSFIVDRGGWGHQYLYFIDNSTYDDVDNITNFTIASRSCSGLACIGSASIGSA